MPMTKYEQLRAEARDVAHEAAAYAKTARLINAKGAGGDLTPSDQAEFQRNYDLAIAKSEESKNLERRAAAVERDQGILDQAKALADQVEAPGGFSNRTLSRDLQGWASKTADTVSAAMPGRIGQKSVISGTVRVSNPIAPDVARIGQVPTTLLDLMPIEGNDAGGNTFTFLRQTVRTNNAAPVADGALKPTSVFTFVEIEDRYRTIAHLSEPVPQRYFSDYAGLEQFLNSEMEYGLRLAVEAQAINGSGGGENLTGILNTSGIISQAAVSGDLVATLRKAVTQLQINGGVPTAFVLHPSDMERVDLLREGAGTGSYLMGGPGAAAEQHLWNIPRVPSTALTAGTAVLGQWDQAKVLAREDASVAIDISGDNFTHNLATMRLEGRYGLAVLRPAAFVKVTLPA